MLPSIKSSRSRRSRSRSRSRSRRSSRRSRSRSSRSRSRSSRSRSRSRSRSINRSINRSRSRSRSSRSSKNDSQSQQESQVYNSIRSFINGEKIDGEKIDEDITENSIDISIKKDDVSLVDKLTRCSSQQSLQSLQSLQSQQSLPSLQSLPLANDSVTSRNDNKLDPDCLDIIEGLYLDCQQNLREFFNSSKIAELNRILLSDKFDNKCLQIQTNTGTPDKFILEINTYDVYGDSLRNKKECVHISLFTKKSADGSPIIRGLHFTLPDNKITAGNKMYSHLYIGHKAAEDSLASADAPNKFIRIALKSMGTYFETQMSINDPGESAKPRVLNFIKDLNLTPEQISAIGKLLKDIGDKYMKYIEALPPSGAARRGGMKIMKYNKVVEKSNSKDGKNTLINNKELKINKIKDKIKILKQDKIKNKDKIIKQIKLIEDIKTKIKIEKERAKQKHKEKTSIIKREASVSKTPNTTTAKPKTTTAKPKTTTAKPKTTTAKPKTTTAKPKTTTAKPKTPKTTTAKPKTTTAKPKTTTAKPKTPKTTTAKPKTTTAKPKTKK